MPNAVAVAGWAMMALAGILLIVGLAAFLPRLLRVRRLARRFAGTWALEGAALEGLLATRSELRRELDGLAAPVRRTLRWVRHPLVVALIRSRRARRSRRRTQQL